MMRPEAVIERFELWRRLGWMRPLEARFVAFLVELAPDADGRVALAGGLVSHALAEGHVGLDLAALVENPARWLALPPDEPAAVLAERFDDQELALAVRAVDEDIRALDVEDWLALLGQSRLVSNGPGTTPLVLDGTRLYLRRNWAASREVYADLAARGRPQPLPLEADRLAVLFDELFPRGADESGPDWQKIACAVALRHGFSIITGGPGTGKTWTLVKLLALLQAVNQATGAERALRILLAAPTGKAAARMTEAVRESWNQLPAQFRVEAWRPEEARTLHRLLGTRNGSRRFHHQPANPVQADVVIVDEASMIDLQMMHALLGGLDGRTRLVLLGDKDQLASVEPGAVFGDLCRGADRVSFEPELAAWVGRVTDETVAGASPDPLPAAPGPSVMLRQPRRFNTRIAALAAVVNAGRADAAIECLDAGAPVLARLQPASPEDETLGRLLIDEGYRGYLAALGRMPSPERSGAVADWAGECLAELGRFQVLTATRAGPWGVEALNERIRRRLVAAGLIDDARTWFHGRPVMITRNDYRTGLMNGDVGLCLDWPQPDGRDRLRVVFRKADGLLHHYAPSRIGHCQTAWAMTVHKAQGSEFDHAVLILPDRPSRVLSRELIYTGLTRARSRFTLVAAEPVVLERAIAQRSLRSAVLPEPG
ncbi:MAG: exodeoxyribonuclease V subunit alpha [Wenzhouxiangella sp.]